MSPRGPKPGQGAGGRRPGSGRVADIAQRADALRQATKKAAALKRLDDDALRGCIVQLEAAVVELENEQRRRRATTSGFAPQEE